MNPVASPVPDWLQISAAAATTLGAVGVVIALVTFAIQRLTTRKEREERANQAEIDRQRHDAQIAALRQAEDDRLAAQARRIVPAIFRGNVVSNTLWNLRIDNYSTDVVSNIEVDIIIHGGNGKAVPHGYRLANRETLAEIMASVMVPEFSRAMDAVAVRFNQYIEYMRTRVMSLANPNDPAQIAAIQAEFEGKFEQVKLELDAQTAAILQAQVNHAVQTRLTDDWQSFLAPGQFTAMAIETTSPDYTPHLDIRFEDASGYRWARTDTEGPKRLHEPPK